MHPRFHQRNPATFGFSFVSLLLLPAMSDCNLLDSRYVTYIGIAYQLPGAVAGERAMLITEYMRAMGLLDSARIMYASTSIHYSFFSG